MGLVARKPVSGTFWQNEIQTSLLSYRDQLENWNFVCSKSRYDTTNTRKNIGADQTANMRRLVYAFVVRNPRRQVFSRRGPYIHVTISFVLGKINMNDKRKNLNVS